MKSTNMEQRRYRTMIFGTLLCWMAISADFASAFQFAPSRPFQLSSHVGCHEKSFSSRQIQAYPSRSLFESPFSSRRHVTGHKTRKSSSSSSLAMVSSLGLTSKVNLDIVSVVAGFGILCGYHLLLAVKERRGIKSWRSAQADTREKWSQFVRETEGWLYAIQTLRNAITANTFLSTTVLSLLTVIAGRLWEIIRNMDGGSSSRKYMVTQFTVVAACMLTSAYHFLQSARFMTHAGFMFPVEAKGSTKVDRIMRKSQNAQWVGLRFLYVSLGVISWVVGGPRVFLVSSVVLSLFFSSIDQVPEGVDNDFTCG